MKHKKMSNTRTKISELDHDGKKRKEKKSVAHFLERNLKNNVNRLLN